MIHAFCLAAALVAAPGLPAKPALSVVALDAAAATESRVRRALQALATADTLAARRELAACDYAAAPPPRGLDRAAFLLGGIELAQGQRAAFLRLTEAVAGWPGDSAWVRWLQARRAFELAAEATLHGSAGEALAQLRTLVADSTDAAVLQTLRALTMEESGADAAALWNELARNPAGRIHDDDLVGMAALRAARAAAERGQSATPWLARVPPASRYAKAARRLGAVLDSAAAAGLNPVSGATDGGGEGRLLRLAEATRRLDAGRWASADSLYAALDAETLEADRRMAALSDSSGIAATWNAWDATQDGGRRFLLAHPAMATADPLLESALDHHALPPNAVEPTPLIALWSRPAADASPLPPPTAGERGAIDSLDARRADAAHQERQLSARLRETLDDAHREARWYERGERARRAGQAAADSLDRALVAAQAGWPLILQRLEAVVAAERLRLVRRAEALAGRSAAIDLERARIERVLVEGPQARRSARERRVATAAREQLTADAALNATLQAAARGLAERAPDLIDRSLAELWRPAVADRLNRLVAEGAALRAHDAQLAASLAAARASALDPARFEAMNREARGLLAERATLDSTDRAQRRDIVLASMDRLRASLRGQAEAVDFGRVVAGYRLALAATDADSSAAARPAVERLRFFLAAHPASRARGEARYWLADLLLAGAREDFMARMARFTGAADSSAAGSAGSGSTDDRSFAGFVDYAPALEIFRSILAEDLSYKHTDAVLYHVGMILSEQGEAAADDTLRRLVRDFPRSPFVQEATLRLAEDALASQDGPDATPLLEQAAQGADPALRVVALYRLGWARSGQERYEEACVAFRRLLDEYAGGRAILLKTDLRAEATDCLVQCLARAGGAPAFESVFGAGAAGTRPYAAELLDRLGATLQEASLYRDAVAADRLYLRRYSERARALSVAGRLLASFERSNQADGLLVAREDVGGLFAPGSDWARAQAADSLKRAGAEFARVALADAAVEHHRRARAAGTADGWAHAAALYERLLRLWPDHADAPRLNLYAGEVSEHEARLSEARVHYDRAAGRDTAQWGTEALWCRARLLLAAGDSAAAAADLHTYRARAAAPAERALIALDLEIDAWHGAGRPVEAADLLVARAARRAEATEAAPALYRAGLDYTAGGRPASALDAWRQVAQRYPEHELAADALIQIAGAQVAREPLAAADTYRRFAEGHPGDPRAPDALLKSIDLTESTGDTTRADALRRAFVQRFPGDGARSLELLTVLAGRELDRLPAEADVSTLLRTPTSDLASCVRQSEKQKAPLAADLGVRVDFLNGEELARGCSRVALTQPLAKSLARRKKLLAETLTAWARCGAQPASSWARAAAFRTGQALVDFGEALKISERPGGLSAADRRAYDDVVDRQAWTYFDKGEKIWSDLLKQSGGIPAGTRVDPWVLRARQALWPRLAQRFYFRPEAEQPGRNERAIAAHRDDPKARPTPTAAAAPDGGDQSHTGDQR